MKQLINLIREVFEITSRLYENIPNYIQKNRKLLVKRLGKGAKGRSLSAPPVLFRNILSSTILPISKIRKMSSQKSIPDQRQQDSEEEYYRRMSFTQQRQEDNKNRRKISPEPMIRSNIPKPLFPSGTTTNTGMRNNNCNYLEAEYQGVQSSYSKPLSHRGRSMISGMDPRKIGEKGSVTTGGGGRSRSFSPSLLSRNYSQPQSRVRIRTPEKQRKHGKITNRVSSSPSSPSASFLSSSNLSFATKPHSKHLANKQQSNHSSYSDEISRKIKIRKLESLLERKKAQDADLKIRNRSIIKKLEEEAQLRQRQQKKLQPAFVPTSPLPSSPSKRKGMKSVVGNVSNSVDLKPRSENNGRNGSTGRPGRIVDDSKTGGEGKELFAVPAASSSVSALPSRYQQRQHQQQQHRDPVTSSLSSFPGSLRQHGDWSPPPPDPIEAEKACKLTASLPSITQAQLTTIRDWLLSLGISVLDGEGGYYSNDDSRKEGNSSLSSVISTNIVPLSLSKDRLRNGETFCLLFCYLESVAAYHCSLFRTIYRNPRTLLQAKSNFDKVLWLFRMKASPPLSLVYLYQPAEEFIKCNKNVIWGLLWEIMQVYSSSSTAEGRQQSKDADGKVGSLGYNSSQFFGNLHPQPINTAYYRPSQQHHHNPTSSLPSFPSSSAAAVLPSSSASSHQLFQYDLSYSPVQRRSLDISLLDWLSSKGILQLILGNLSRPPTILALETYIKDGTLLCLLCEKVLNLSLFSSSGYHKHPHTYSLCLSNIMKVIKLLKGCKAMPSRFLYQGIEEDIARGKWDSILGLLEDMHFFSDSIEQYQLFPYRRSSAAYPDDSYKENGGNKDGMIGGTHVAAIPPLVTSWNMIDRPYLGLSSVKRNQSHSTSSIYQQQQPQQQFSQQQEGERKEYALLRNVRSGNNHHKSNDDPSYDSNHVRLDHYYPVSHEEGDQRNHQNERPDAADLPADKQRFRPSLDLRNSLPTTGGIQQHHNETEDEEDGDDNDVSFLFSPSKEEEKEEQRRSIDLLPKPTTTTEAFQNGLLHKHHPRSTSPSSGHQFSMKLGASFPSIKDMTAVDSALLSLEGQRYGKNAFSPDARNINREEEYANDSNHNYNNSSGTVDASPSSIAQDSLSPKATNSSHLISSTKKKNLPLNKRDISPNPSSLKATNGILLSLQQIIEWIFSLGVKIPFDRKHLKEISPSSSSASLVIDNLVISPALLKDFGLLFNDGLILAQIVKKLSHQEINGLFERKEVKPDLQKPLQQPLLTSLTQAQRRYNINKSLELLTMNNKKIPLRNLACVDEISHGDSVTILELLEKIKKAYNFVV
jgi:hypothetical protein